MIDLIKTAFSPGVLPLSLLVVAIGLYWICAMVGVVAMDILDFAFDLDASQGVGGSMQSALRYMGASEVPLVALLSFLGIFMWGCSMAAHFFWNPELEMMRGLAISAASVFPAAVLTKFATIPLRPFFRSLKGSEGEAKPVVGRLGRVRSRVLDERSGQVEVVNDEAPLLVNARLMPGSAPLERGAEVEIFQYDQESGIYLVTTPQNPKS